MNKKPNNKQPDSVRRPFKVALLVFFVLLMIVSFVLRLVTTGGFVYPRKRPVVAFELPYLLTQLAALDSGLHFLVMRQRWVSFELHFERRTSLGVVDYHHSRQVKLLGFTAAIMPRMYSQSDSILSPYAAIVIPYWFLIGCSSLAVVCLSSLGRLLRPRCRFSKTAGGVMVLILGGFIVANVVPSRDDSGPSYSEGGAGRSNQWLEWYRLCFEPGSYPEIVLEYGFPFVCYRRALLNGHSVGILHGDDRFGWRQHLLMENVCLAFVTMAVAGMAIDWMRSFGKSRLRNNGEDEDG